MNIFITGTDTDCGKTKATRELLHLAKTRNIPALAIKPVATGCKEVNGVLVSEDVEYYGAQSISYDRLCPWKFSPPVSPHLATVPEESPLKAKDIVEYCTSFSREGFDFVLIEGAGGLLVPLNSEETWVDVITMGQFQVILVVGIRLGCINHALLSALALHHHGIQGLGWVANGLDAEVWMLEEVIDTLKQRLRLPYLGTIGYKEGLLPSARLNSILS